MTRLILFCRNQTFMAGRCMFYLTFIWFSGAAYNVWQLVLNTSCYVPILSNNNMTDFFGLPVYPPAPVIEDGIALDSDMLADRFKSELLLKQDDLVTDYNVPMEFHHSTNVSSPMYEMVFSVKQCGAYQHFISFHVGFYVADIFVIYLIPIVSFFYLYASMLYHVLRTKGFKNVQNGRRILMSFFFVVIFYICYLPPEFIDPKLVDATLLSGKQVIKRKFIETLTFTHGVWVFVVYLLCSEEVLWLIQKQRLSHTITTTEMNNILSRDSSSNPKVPESPTNREKLFISTDTSVNENNPHQTHEEMHLSTVPKLFPARKGFIQTDV